MATLPAVHVESGRLDPALSQESTVASPSALRASPTSSICSRRLEDSESTKPDERIPAAAKSPLCTDGQEKGCRRVRSANLQKPATMMRTVARPLQKEERRSP